MATGRFDQGNMWFNQRDRNFPDRVVRAAVQVDRFYATTPEFRGLKPSRRNCLYPTELDLGPVFPMYSQANCFLRCAFLRAGDVCGCLPWYLLGYPMGQWAGGGRQLMCENLGMTCFQESVGGRWLALALNQTDPGCTGACLPDCEAVEYVPSWEGDTSDSHFYEDQCGRDPYEISQYRRLVCARRDLAREIESNFSRGQEDWQIHPSLE